MLRGAGCFLAVIAVSVAVCGAAVLLLAAGTGPSEAPASPWQATIEMLGARP